MPSFIFELSRALGRALAARLRDGGERASARGESMAIAAVLEILGQLPDQDNAGEAPDCEIWDAMERAAERDLELVKRARSGGSANNESR